MYIYKKIRVKLNERVVAFPIRFDEVEVAARRLLSSIRALVDIDTRIATGQPVPTRPGSHCRNCRRIRLCPDADETALAELPTAHAEPDVEEDESW